MIDGKSVVALVPARSGSKGLTGKNTRDLAGKPLLGWSIEQAISSKYIDEVFVSTDCSKIASVGEHFGGQVPFLRPPELASDEASSIDVIIHLLDYLERTDRPVDIIVLLEPTSPLRELKDIDGSIELCAREDNCASVVGVAEVEGAHPAFLFSLSQQGRLNPYLESPPNGLRRQDIIGRLYFLEGSVYVSDARYLKATKAFYHDKTLPWIVDRYKALEIDTVSDFIIAEALMRAQLKGVL